jgi:citrate lyase synthetase
LNRGHPKNLLPTWNGDSIGHWEGDTLVADTIGFNDKSWLHPAMQPHTEEAHLIERFRQVSNGGSNFLEMAATVEDRKALTSAFTFTRYFRKTGESMPENICNDDIEIWRNFKNKALKRDEKRAQEVR